MGKTWQLQEAEDRFSSVVDEALKDGPQVIARGDVKTVVVIAVDEYEKLTRPKGSFLEFLRNSPLWGVDLDIERSKDTGREVDFG